MHSSPVMEGDTAVGANYIFRGIEYAVTMNMLNDNELTVEVEDRQTTDQWRGKFDSACELSVNVPQYFHSRKPNY